MENGKLDSYDVCKKAAESRVNSYLYEKHPQRNEQDFNECFRTCIGSGNCSAFREGNKIWVLKEKTLPRLNCVEDDFFGYIPN